MIGKERVKMRVWAVCMLVCLLIERSIFQTDDYDDDDGGSEYYDYNEPIEDEVARSRIFLQTGQAATIEEQVSSLQNETDTKKQTLTRLEAFFEQLERRILRLEAANNGTRGVTESVPESMTSPAPETTTNLPCCHKIKLKSRKTNSNHHPFLGVYVYDNFDAEDDSPEVFNYEKFSEGGEILSTTCGNGLKGVYSVFDECEDYIFNFVSGFTGSCITGPKLYTVQWYNEGQRIWEEDDSLTIVCVD